jgi:hypothetical protein
MACEAMDDMAERYADRGVTSVFIYTREAHPGENLRHHTSREVKRARARAFQEECGVRRRILLDDLEGSAHHRYGLLPNMSWILARGGLILYKAAWTHAEDLEDALETSLKAMAGWRIRNLNPAYTERLLWRVKDEEAFRAGLERAGPQAVKDFYG